MDHPKPGTSKSGIVPERVHETEQGGNASEELEEYSDSQDEGSWSGSPSEGEIQVKKDSKNMSFVCETLCRFDKEGSKYLSFNEGETMTVIAVKNEEWWEAENADGKRGLVPSTLLKVSNKVKEYLKVSQDSAGVEQNQFWEQLRKVVRKEKSYDMSWLTDYSTLSQLLKKDTSYSTKAYLFPTTDMFGCNPSFALKPVAFPLQKVVKLVAFREIFQPPPNYEVSSRHVRLCLHDGNKVLSNIHTVKAKWDSKTPKLWTFEQKSSSDSFSAEEGCVFIRSNKKRTTLGLLFELCMMLKTENVDEYREMSCGWVFTRLLNDDGLPVTNKTKVLKVNRGPPFASAEPLMSSYENESTLKNLMSRNKTPRIVITMSNPNKVANDHLSYLPYTLIGRVSSISMILLYRMQLAEAVMENSSIDTFQSLHSPLLANFPRVIDEPDLYDIFRKVWRDNNKKEMSYLGKKRDDSRKSFRALFMESVFLILQSCNLPPYSLGNTKIEQERKLEIARLYNIIKDNKSFAPLSKDIEYKPISNMVLTTPLCRPFYLGRV